MSNHIGHETPSCLPQGLRLTLGMGLSPCARNSSLGRGWHLTLSFSPTAMLPLSDLLAWLRAASFPSLILFCPSMSSFHWSKGSWQRWQIGFEPKGQDASPQKQEGWGLINSHPAAASTFLLQCQWAREQGKEREVQAVTDQHIWPRRKADKAWKPKSSWQTRQKRDKGTVLEAGA